MSGKAAALGGRLMGPVADQMLKQFVANFAARLQTLQVPQTEQTAMPSSDPGVAPAATGRDKSQAELNGLAFAWAVLRDWLRDIFSRKTA